jgi:Tol biopolymer transport system component/cytosine/adenosine deaminase-related metal-dependent hydrolase
MVELQSRPLGIALGLLLCAPFACTSGLFQTASVSSGTQFGVTGDDQYLYTDMQGILWRLPADGGTAVALTDATDDLRRPALSPDGQWLAAQSFATGAWDIVLLNTAGGEKRNLTRSMADDQEPAWSRDGMQVLFSSDRAGSEDIWSVDIASGALTRLTEDEADVFAPATTPAGFIYIAARGNKQWLEQTTSAEPLAEAPAGRLAGPSVSPAGDKLAWVQARVRNGFPGVARNEIVVMDLSTREQQVISGRMADVFDATPHWVNDTTLIYTADGRIQSVDLITQARQQIEFSARFPVRRDRFRQTLPLALKNSAQPVLGIVDPIMLPDNSIVFTALGDLWRLGNDGTLTQLTNDAFVERDVNITPASNSLVFISDRGGNGMQIWEYELASGVSNAITTKANGPRYPTWSPDGKYLAYQQAGPIGVKDFTVRVIELATGENRKLRSSPKIWPGRMAWSADSKHLLVAELQQFSQRASDGRNRLVRINVGIDMAGTTELPVGVTIDFGPVASPDGSQLAVIINGELWVLPLTREGRAAGEPERVLEELVEYPAWSENSKILLALTNQGLETIDVATGKRALRKLDATWQPAQGEDRWILHAGKLWDGLRDDYLDNVDILIEGSKIIAVSPHADHRNTRVVDASSQTVLPGLIDHHMHFEGHKGEWIGRALLAFGVTTVVEPGGLPYESREHMESWLSGRRYGPRLIFAGPQLDGYRRTFNFGAHIESPERLQRELERGERLGYGLIKTYRRLRPELQALAVELAHEQGLPVTAHAALRNPGNGGNRTEHLRGSGRLSYSGKQSELLKTYGDIQSIYAQAGSSVTPTVVTQGGFLAFARNNDLDAITSYTNIYTPAYRSSVDGLIRFASRNRELIDAGLANAQANILAFQEAGVRIVAGTDSPIFPYGLALIAELNTYVDAGLTPAAALRTATSDAAAELGGGEHIGRIAPGLLADMLIVDGDPLTEIADLTNVEQVVLNGRQLTIDALTESL